MALSHISNIIISFHDRIRLGVQACYLFSLVTIIPYNLSNDATCELGTLIAIMLLGYCASAWIMEIIKEGCDYSYTGQEWPITAG